MSFAFANSAALALVGTLPSPYSLVERWYEDDAGQPLAEGISPERRVLQARAEEALNRARPVVRDAWMPAADEEQNLVPPPLVIERRVKTTFRWVAPLPPPMLDEDDLPL
jgi:hypothetical protein